MTPDLVAGPRYRRMVRKGAPRAASRAVAGTQHFTGMTILPASARRWAAIATPRTGPTTDKPWSLFVRRQEEAPESQRIIPLSMEDDVFASFHAETIRKRLVELRLAAGDEGIEWDQDSELGMWTFLRRSGVSSRPFLTLREDGHIRALWENDQGEQIGLQFLDSIMVQYVIFSRMGSGGIGRTYGVGEQSVVRALIDATGVAGLLNA